MLKTQAPATKCEKRKSLLAELKSGAWNELYKRLEPFDTTWMESSLGEGMVNLRPKSHTALFIDETGRRRRINFVISSTSEGFLADIEGKTCRFSVRSLE